jgi:hypothetical protein
MHFHFRIILREKGFLHHSYQIKLIRRPKKIEKSDSSLNEMKLEKILSLRISELHTKFSLRKEEIENENDGLKIIFKLKSMESIVDER